MNNDYLKFRVIDKSNKTVLPANEPDYIIDEEGNLWKGFLHYEHFSLVRGDYIVERCTGSRDKNGKLIYEGDKVKTVTGKTGVVEWNEYWCRFEVVFDFVDIYTDSCAVDGTQEIIGNIHDKENNK